MKRRQFLKSTLGLAFLNKTYLLATALNAKSNKINILFLMDDQHRGDCIGADGAEWVDTPNLDKLASEGALFKKAYSSLPSCRPARASILTGRSPWGHGLLLYAPIPPSYKNGMPQWFTDAGYRTYAVGKMHFDSHLHGYQTVILEEAWRWVTKENFKGDYRKWFEKKYPHKDVDATGLSYIDHRGNHPFLYKDKLHPTNWTAERGIDFLENYCGSRPWFLKVSFKRPHPPFDPPKRLLDKYKDSNLPKAKVGKWAEEKFGKFKGRLEENPSSPRGNYPESDIHESRAAYYASISHVDEQVGRVIKALKKRGEYKNTLILFTSDHGDMMGDQHLWRKTYPYEPSARVPMIIRWPEKLNLNAKRGQKIKKPVELRDIFPTFASATDLSVPPQVEGDNMLKLIKNNNCHWREVLDLEHGTCYWKENAWTALTDGKYKYIYFTLTGEQQLFDLEKDPYELTDLASDDKNSDLLKEWRKKMAEHLSERGEPWVKGVDLAIQKKSITYGPNSPIKKAPPLK